jgi:hypothetical protein
MMASIWAALKYSKTPQAEHRIDGIRFEGQRLRDVGATELTGEIQGAIQTLAVIQILLRPVHERRPAARSRQDGGMFSPPATKIESVFAVSRFIHKSLRPRHEHAVFLQPCGDDPRIFLAL